MIKVNTKGCQKKLPAGNSSFGVVCPFRFIVLFGCFKRQKALEMFPSVALLYKTYLIQTLTP